MEDHITLILILAAFGLVALLVAWIMERPDPDRISSRLTCYPHIDLVEPCEPGHRIKEGHMAHDRFDIIPRTSRTRAVAERLVQEAFGRIREKRSAAYQQGTTDVLFERMGIEALKKCPYLPGQAEFDAYWAGADEGKEIYRRYIESEKEV